jgi:hypothetical protein
MFVNESRKRAQFCAWLISSARLTATPSIATALVLEKPLVPS